MPHVRLRGVIAQRPAVPAAVLLVLGICLHPALPHLPILWIALLAPLLILSIVLMRRSTVVSSLLAVAILDGGVALGQLEAFYFPANHLSAFVSEQPRLAWVEGTIESIPRITEGSERGGNSPTSCTWSSACARCARGPDGRTRAVKCRR